MTDREKLIELLDAFSTPVTLNGEKLMDWMIPIAGLRRALADYLLANGVTFATDNNDGSKWIPVSVPPKERECYFVTVKHWLDGKPVTREAYWNGADWLSCDKRHELTPRVTHWMPLPEPPQEEK